MVAQIIMKRMPILFKWYQAICRLLIMHTFKANTQKLQKRQVEKRQPITWEKHANNNTGEVKVEQIFEVELANSNHKGEPPQIKQIPVNCDEDRTRVRDELETTEKCGKTRTDL